MKLRVRIGSCTVSQTDAVGTGTGTEAGTGAATRTGPGTGAAAVTGPGTCAGSGTMQKASASGAAGAANGITGTGRRSKTPADKTGDLGRVAGLASSGSCEENKCYRRRCHSNILHDCPEAVSTPWSAWLHPIDINL